MDIKKYIFSIIILLLFLIPLVSAAMIKGNIYNDNLEIEKDILIKVNTIPEQQYLSKDGSYVLFIPQGKYVLTAQKGFLLVNEEINIVNEGEYNFDIFLIPDFIEEDELWTETEEELVDDSLYKSNVVWIWILVFVILVGLIWFNRKNKLLNKIFKKNRKRNLEEKVIEEVKEELNEPIYLNETIEIIKKYDGRISQKELRREMMHLSEAKISLILTELEHKGRIEKIKKGRGNVVLLK